MSVYAAAFALFLGIVYGRLIGRVNPAFFALALAFASLGFGNYPGYPVEGVSIILLSCGTGILIGGVAKR